jgi:acyl-CoA thioesterase
VVALQGGEVIFNMSVSFAAPGEGPDLEVDPVPDAEPPDGLPSHHLPRLFSFEGRRPSQPYPDAHWPTRFWARSTVPLPDDPLVHACALTYLSDIGTGLVALPADEASPGPSLDHALWFHRPARLVHRHGAHRRRRPGRELRAGDAVPAGAQPVPPATRLPGAAVLSSGTAPTVRGRPHAVEGDRTCGTQ